MEVNFEHRLTAVEDRSKSNTKRIDEMEKRQDDLDDLVTTVKVLATREENVESDVKEIKKDVKDLTGRSGKRWDDLVDKFVWAIAAAGLGFILAQIGL
jgi:hypothetical protein